MIGLASEFDPALPWWDSPLLFLSALSTVGPYWNLTRWYHCSGCCNCLAVPEAAGPAPVVVAPVAPVAPVAVRGVAAYGVVLKGRQSSLLTVLLEKR